MTKSLSYGLSNAYFSSNKYFRVAILIKNWGPSSRGEYGIIFTHCVDEVYKSPFTMISRTMTPLN